MACSIAIVLNFLMLHTELYFAPTRFRYQHWKQWEPICDLCAHHKARQTVLYCTLSEILLLRNGVNPASYKYFCLTANKELNKARV